MSGSGTGSRVTQPTDGYVDISAATSYFSGSPRAIDFLALGVGMDWYLREAAKIIDRLPLRGRKYQLDGTQERQFPRQYREGYDRNELTGVAEVPQNVLDACCEEALAIYLFLSDSDRTDRKTMSEDGVKNYNLGGVYSETLSASNSDKHRGLLSSEAYQLLEKHIARSFPIV